MKAKKTDDAERSAVSGKLMKKKVKKSSKDKEVNIFQYVTCQHCDSFVFDGIVQRDKNRKQLLDFLNSSVP